MLLLVLVLILAAVAQAQSCHTIHGLAVLTIGIMMLCASTSLAEVYFKGNALTADSSAPNSDNKAAEGARHWTS